MKRLLFTYIFTLYAGLLLADDQINIVNYNLFSPNIEKKGNIALQEKALHRILDKSNATIYSIGRGKAKYKILPLSNHQRPSYKIAYNETPYFQHCLLYDSTKVTLKYSVATPRKNHVVLHYSFEIKDNKKSLDIFYFKLSEKRRFYHQYQTVLNIINNLEIKDRIILLGGSSSMKTINNSYRLENTDGLRLKNPITLSELFDKNKMLTKNTTQDFIFLSSDLWSMEQPLYYKYNSATLRTDFFDKKFSKKLSDIGFGYPYSLELKVTNSKQFSTPALEITSQDKENLNFNIQWSKKTRLSLNIISMIGNVFTQKIIEYNGGKQDISIDLSNYPTGIFILKIESEDKKVLLRKFSKY